MSDLTEHRAELTDALEAVGITAHGYLPERLNPPCALVTEAEPWITPETGPAARFGAWVATYDVTLIAGQGTNQRATLALVGLVQTALPALDTQDWEVTEVGQFFELTTGTARHLATRIRVNTRYERE